VRKIVKLANVLKTERGKLPKVMAYGPLIKKIGNVQLTMIFDQRIIPRLANRQIFGV
jgi:hypothetical protein